MSSTRNLALTIEQMIDYIPGYSYQDKLNHLVNCNCCARHQVNKPIVFEPWRETPTNNTNRFIYPCMCNCRHAARFICRQAIYSPPPPIRINSPTSIIDS